MAELGPLGLYGLSVGMLWLAAVEYLLVQRELGQVCWGKAKKNSRYAGFEWHKQTQDPRMFSGFLNRI